MKEIIRNVPYNNPSLIPLSNYDIEIKNNLMFEMPNHGSYGNKNEGRWSIINKYDIDGKEVIQIDLTTLKKALDKIGMYPDMKDNEVFTLCQIRLTNDMVEIFGDIVTIKKVNK